MTAPFKHLKPGCRYVVRADFTALHPEGETWTFRSHSFLPYEDGLSLFVGWPDGTERQIRLQWRPETQGAIIGALDRFITPAED